MISVVEMARRAKKQCGRSVVAQLIEIACLRYGRYRLRAVEYFDYRLFTPGIPWREKRNYIGSWIKDRVYRVQDPKTAALCSNKLTAYRRFDEIGIPYPRLLAATGQEQPPSGAVWLTNENKLAEWLRYDAPYPIFAKPAVGYRGYGNAKLSGYDRASDSLILGNGTQAPVSTYAARHGAPGAPVLLFQELIRPHPALAAVIGDRASTARIMVLNDGAEPELWRGGLRIPVGKNMVDNFRDGDSGNLLTKLDLQTGKIVKAYQKFGLDQREVEHHPDTGQAVVGLTLPDWPQAVALVKAASKAIPGLRIHHWDVAFTDAGPMLIETNPRGDFGIPQFMGHGGMAVPRFLKLYKSHAI